MPLIELGTDVLGHLFALTDVYTMLSLSRVNRLFHDITSTKQPWLSVVRDLAARQLIAPLVDIDKLSKDALVDEVKRVVAGPRTWSPESPLTPKLSSRFTFPLNGSRSAELLPGNAYILCCVLASIPGTGFGAVECFETQSGRLAWSWSRPGFSVRGATFDFLGGTSEAMVALIVSTPTDQKIHLIVLQVDLKTGHSHDLAHFPLALIFPWAPRLCGDFFICHVKPNSMIGHWFILLLNWRAENFVLLDLDTARPTNAQTFFDLLVLLPGHLALTRHGSGTPSTSSLQVHLYPITNFGHLWLPMSSFNFNDSASIDVRQLSSVHLQVDDENPLRYGVTLTCDESVLHHDTYELSVQFYELMPPSAVTRFASRVLERLRFRTSTRPRPPSPFQVTMARYHVVLPPQRYSSSELPQLIFKSVFRHSREIMSASRAGYGLEGRRGEPHLVCRLDEIGIGAPKKLDLDLDSAVRVELTPLGAVFVREKNRAVILYYQ